jgi:predicted N-acetyltransferase YhbS
MQALVAASFGQTHLRVGDIAWAARDYTHWQLAVQIRLWETRNGELAGWTWVQSNGWLEPMFLEQSHRSVRLLDEMLDHFEETVAGMRAAGDPLARSFVPIHHQDEMLRVALVERGFEVADWSLDILTQTLDKKPEATSLPEGYGLTSVTDEPSFFGRVEAQRAAFGPWSFTAEKLQRLTATWPYRPALDRLVVDAEGTVVALCTAWIDEQNRAGLLEPVGTHPEHQRKGLGRAVCFDALGALYDAGARSAQVLCMAGSGACRVYAAVGFEKTGSVAIYTKQVDPSG